MTVRCRWCTCLVVVDLTFAVALAAGETPPSPPAVDHVKAGLASLGIVDDERFPRREAVLSLLSPLQLLVDLAAGRSWSPLGTLSDDFGDGLEIVHADPTLADRLRERLGWLDVDGCDGMEFAIEAFHHGFDERALGSYWAYRGHLDRVGGAFQTVAVWPTDGIHDQVPWKGAVHWTEQSLEAEDAVPMPDRMSWDRRGPLDLRHNLHWIGEYQFGSTTAVLVTDSGFEIDRILVRNLAGEVVCMLSADFDGDALRRITLELRPIVVEVDLGGTIEYRAEDGTMVRLDVPDHHYRRWPQGHRVEIDFTIAAPGRDLPWRVRGWQGDRQASIAWIRELVCDGTRWGSDAMLEDSATFLAGIPVEQTNAVESTMTAAGPVHATAIRGPALAFVERMLEWSSRHELPRSLALQSLEIWIERLADAAAATGLPLDGVIAELAGAPWTRAVAPLEGREILQQVIRQCAQDRPFQADRTWEAGLDRVERTQHDESADRWIDRFSRTLREWASEGRVPGAMPFVGRRDLGASPGRLLLSRVLRQPATPPTPGARP